MKMRVLSDLHLESYIYYYEYMGEDILLLVGDIDTKTRHNQILNAIPQHVRVVMVAGNHELYNQEYYKTYLLLHELELKYSNFYFLDNSTYDIGNISIFGGTMWTDFELYGNDLKNEIMNMASKGIYDYKTVTIKDGDVIRQYTPNDSVEQYKKFNRNFDRWIENSKGKTRICMSHFLPSIKSIDKKFDGSLLNAYFASNNEERVKLVDYWVHGHTHSKCDYILGDTRVLCNPKGYGAMYMENPNFNNSLIVEID